MIAAHTVASHIHAGNLTREPRFDLDIEDLTTSTPLSAIHANSLAVERMPGIGDELSPNFGDGLRVQAAAVWDFEDAGLAATSIPSVNLTP